MFRSPIPADGVSVNERAFAGTSSPSNRTVFCVLFLPSSLHLQRTQICDWSHMIFAPCSDAYNSDLSVRARKNLLKWPKGQCPCGLPGSTTRTTSSGAMLRFFSTHLFQVFRVDRYSFINLFQHLEMGSCVNCHLYLGLNARSLMTLCANCPPICP